MNSNYYFPSVISYVVENKSLYIPKVFSTISKEYMISIFETLGIGMVNHIDFVPKITSNGKIYNSAYIHFDYWYNNLNNQNFQYNLNFSVQNTIVYDAPWYWLVFENKAEKKDYSIPRKKINLDNLNKVDDIIKDTVDDKKKMKIYEKIYENEEKNKIVKQRMFLPRVLTKPGGCTSVNVSIQY
jgi:hypothetical protein